MQRPRSKSLVGSGNSQLQYADVEVGNWWGKEKARGRVKKRHPGMGRGVESVEVSEEDRNEIKKRPSKQG